MKGQPGMIRVTLAECRQLYEEFTGKDMPKDMPYYEAAQYVHRRVGDIDFKKRLASIRRRKGMKGNPGAQWHQDRVNEYRDMSKKARDPRMRKEYKDFADANYEAFVESMDEGIPNPGIRWHASRAKEMSAKESRYNSYGIKRFYAGAASAHRESARFMKEGRANPTPKKCESKIINGKKFYYIGKTEYWNKALLIKDYLKEKLLGVAITGNRTKKYPTLKQTRSGIYYYIWATEPVYVPMMEVGGSELFNPKRRTTRRKK